MGVKRSICTEHCSQQLTRLLCLEVAGRLQLNPESRGSSVRRREPGSGAPLKMGSGSLQEEPPGVEAEATGGALEMLEEKRSGLGREELRSLKAPEDA